MIRAASASSSEEDLVTLLRRAQDGDADAAVAVYTRCKDPLLGVIRRLMMPRLRRLFDSDDFLILTFQEIFCRHFSDEVLRSPETLWPYLYTIAENKVRDAIRRHVRSKVRDLYRDVPMGDFADLLESKELSPCDILIFKELVEERLADLMHSLPGPMQDIMYLALQGCTAVEIARRLGVEVKRVYRAIEWFKRQVLNS